MAAEPSPDTPSLSQRLRDAALALSGMLNAGELEGAPADPLFALTLLSLELLEYSDDAREIEEAARPRSARELGHAMQSQVMRLRAPLVLIQGGIGAC